MSPDSPDFDWPSPTEIAAAQNDHKHEAPRKATIGDAGLLSIKGAAWVPNDCVDLKLRLLTIAHAGQSGHRGADSTYHALRERFIWTDMREDTRSFVSSCLLCVLSKSGDKVPRPLASTTHSTKPNEVIQFDYLFLGESEDDNKYVLVVKDDLSSYCWLDATPAANAEHTADVLARWMRTFTCPKVWISDQGSHFKNELLGRLSRVHRIKHQFTVAYSP